MSKQRLIDTCFWDDNYILTLDPSEKLLFLYLLTNPLTAICGVYEISIKRMAFDTGFDQDIVRRILGRFERDSRCIYRDGWVAMHNWIKHQTSSPKVQRGIEIQLEKVPEELADYVGGEENWIPSDTISHPNPNPNPNPNSILTSTVDKQPSKPAIPKKPKPPPDPRIKVLIDYYFQAFLGRAGFEPTVNGGTWGAVFKRLLRDCSEQTIRIVIDEFFAYDKRTRFSIYDFERSFDNVYGRLHDLQEGRKRAKV